MVDDLLAAHGELIPRPSGGLMRASSSTPTKWASAWSDVPEPEVGINDVAIHVERAGICGTDVHIWEWNAWAARP